MKRLLFVSIGIGIPGGIANVAGSFLRALDSLTLEGYLEQVDVITYLDESNPARPFSPGRTRHATGSRTKFIFDFVQATSLYKPDYVMFDMVGGARLTRLPLPRLRSIPYGVMVHDALDLNPKTRHGLIPILQNADLIIANSPTTSTRAAALVPDRTHDIKVLSPPVSAARLELWSGIPRRPLTDRGCNVLIASRLDADQPGKGHDALLRAWPTVLDSLPNARLVVAGDGTGRSNLQDLASSLNILSSVDFVGFVTNEQLGYLFADAVVFAMPSQQEGFGMVYAEAMWWGIPCVASTADAAVDVIDQERTGLLIPYGDIAATGEAILRLLKNPENAQKLGDMGRQVCLSRYMPETYRMQLASALHIMPS